MLTQVRKIHRQARQKTSFLIIAAAVKFNALVYRHQGKLLGTAGALMLFSGTEGIAHAQQTYDGQILFGLCRVIALSQGMFGALVMSVAGLVAIVGAAVGSYRTAMNAVAVGAGAYLIRPMVMLFFGDPDCGTYGVTLPAFGGGAGGGAGG